MRLGRIIVGASSALGWTAPAIEGAMRKDFDPLLTLANSALGLALGKGIGTWLAPHEREARKVARETPYMGIVTGTRSADYPETIREKIQRKHASADSKVKSLFWGALDKISTHIK